MSNYQTGQNMLITCPQHLKYVVAGRRIGNYGRPHVKCIYKYLTIFKCLHYNRYLFYHLYKYTPT